MTRTISNSRIRRSRKGHGFRAQGMRATAFVLLALAAIALVSGLPRAEAAPGDLDPSFDGDGKLTTNIAINADTYGLAVAIQGDGKLVLAGSADNGGWQKSFGLARYNTDGTLDTGFSGDGVVQTDFAVDSYDEANAVVVQGDGKILAAGYSDTAGPLGGFALVRYNANGTLDTSFGGDGKVTTAVIDYSQAVAVAIQSDGKIVAAGYGGPYPDSDFVLVRYLADGSLDPTFDGDGILITDAGERDYLGDMQLQADDSIVIVGTSDDHFLIARYDADGVLDPGFDGDGIATLDLGGEWGLASGVAIQSDGRILVSGWSTAVDYTSDFALVRYNSDGSLDTGFDGDGVVLTGYSDHEHAYSVVVQADDKIVIGGDTSSARGYQIALVRYQSDGSLDTGFGSNGIVTTDFGTGDDVYNSAFALALQTDGKIVVGGSDSKFAVLRYNTNGSLDTGFDGDGIALPPVGSSIDEPQAAAVDSAGRLVVGAYTGNYGDFALVRYTPNGTLDSTFGGDGIVTTSFAGETGISNDYLEALAIQADGKILAAGSTWNYPTGTGFDFALARYETDGDLDPTFGTNGIVVTNFGGGSHDYGASVAIQGDGKIVVAGKTGDYPYSIAVARYNTNGTLDSTFDGDGRVTTAVAPSSSGTAVAIQSDGKIVVVGNLNTTAVIVRYNGNGSLDSTFDGDGIVTTPTISGSGLALQEDDGILVVGSDGGDVKLLRYAGNGTLDLTFDGDGIVTTDLGDLESANAVTVQSNGQIVVGGDTDNGSGGSDTDFLVLRYNSDGSLDTGFSGDGAATTAFGGTWEYVAALALQADQKILAVGGASGEFGSDLAVARYLVSTCGDGNAELGEACDDGNGINGDRCDTSCQWESNCSAAPLVGCLEASTVQFQLRKDAANPSRSTLRWKWSSGEAFVQADLGSPQSTTSYSLCVYDTVGSDPTLATWIDVPPSSAFWTSKAPNGFQYKDFLTTADGARVIKLKTGALDRTRVEFAAKGANLFLPAAAGATYFEQDSGVIVQLASSDDRCWTSGFLSEHTSSNDGTRLRFTAKRR
jgi:uncharacterized delta-60 repeat protein